MSWELAVERQRFEINGQTTKSTIKHVSWKKSHQGVFVQCSFFPSGVGSEPSDLKVAEFIP